MAVHDPCWDLNYVCLLARDDQPDEEIAKALEKLFSYKLKAKPVSEKMPVPIVGMIDSAETIYETADGYVLLKHEQFTDGGLATVLSAKESIRWFLSNGIVPPLNALTTEKNGTKEEPTWGSVRATPTHLWGGKQPP